MAGESLTGLLVIISIWCHGRNCHMEPYVKLMAGQSTEAASAFTIYLV